MSDAKAAATNRLGTAMRKAGWAHDVPRHSLRHRLYSIAMDRKPWWDWGNRLMALVGDDHCGNWSEPGPPTWWYRPLGNKRMWRTGFPRRQFQIVTDYDEFKARTEGLNEDQLYEWCAIGTNQDGELHLGHQYWGGQFYGLPHDEWRLVRRYLIEAHRHKWFGLRSWLYLQGLHAAVYAKKPGACHERPPKDSGGYSHWLCRLKRGHDGLHRFNNYTWGEIGGETIGATHVPESGRVGA